MEDSKKDDKIITSEPTEEEKQAEAKALEEVKDDEVRSGVIEDYGLDEDDDAELIEKIVKNTLGEKKALSTAIRQKIKQRAENQDLRKKYEGDEKNKIDKNKEADKEKLDQDDLNTILDKRDRDRDLDALDVSDELKQEIEFYAKTKKLSVKKALESSYIGFLKTKEDKAKEEEEAGAGSESGTRNIKNLDKIENPRKAFDLSTEEGQKQYAEWKKTKKMV